MNFSDLPIEVLTWITCGSVLVALVAACVAVLIVLEANARMDLFNGVMPAPKPNWRLVIVLVIVFLGALAVAVFAYAALAG